MVSITVSSFAEHNCVAMSYKLTILFLLIGFSAASLPAYSALAPEVRKERVEYIYESPLSKKEAITTLAPKIKEVATPSPIKAMAKVVTSPRKTSSKLYPELLPICSCESTGSPGNIPTQFEKDGVTVRMGKVNPKDTGMCQLSQTYWLAESVKLGYNIFTEEGNILMANHIYETYGTKPWKWSQSCWGKRVQEMQQATKQETGSK